MNHPAKPPDALRDDAWRRTLAGFVFHAQLSGRRLPEHLADVPDRMLVDRLARMDAKELLATLQEIYGIEWWDIDSFERAVVRGALEAWRPGSLVQRLPGKLRVVSTTCPIASDVEKDPRICAACQATQKHAAYLALVGQIQDVRFDRVMSRGESACELNVTFRPPRGAKTINIKEDPPWTRH